MFDFSYLIVFGAGILVGLTAIFSFIAILAIKRYTWSAKLKNQEVRLLYKQLELERTNQIALLKVLSDCNIFLNLSHIHDSDIADSFMRTLSDIWTELSLRENFDKSAFRIGFNLDSVKLSPELMKDLQDSGFLISEFSNGNKDNGNSD